MLFAIIGEELGFIGATFLILLYLVLIWRGIRVALTAPDLLAALLAAGIISMIAIQVVINIGNSFHASNRAALALYQLWRLFTGYFYDQYRRPA